MLRFKNETPITDVREALELLARTEPAYTRVKLYDVEPRIETAWASRGYEGSSYDQHRLSQECFDKLQKRGYVEGVPRMGGVERSELQCSRYGREQLRTWREADVAKAKALLVPGTHGWSSQYQYRGIHTVWKNKDDHRSGHVFKAPENPAFIVFLDDNTVEEYKRPL